MDDVNSVPSMYRAAAGIRNIRLVARRARLSPLLVLGVVLVFGPLLATFVARLFVSRHGLQIFAYDPSRAPSSGATGPLGPGEGGGWDTLVSNVRYDEGAGRATCSTLRIEGVLQNYRGGDLIHHRSCTFRVLARSPERRMR